MIQIIMVVGYILITALISLYLSRKAKSDTSSFFTANRSMGTVVVAALLFSEIIGGAGTIGNAANAFNGGLSKAIWANWGMALGCFLVVPTVSKFYRAMSVKYNAMTIPECFAVMFGRNVRVVMVFIVALVYLILYSSQAPAAASIIAPMLNVDETLATWAIALIFIAIAVLGGMASVSLVNVIHCSVMVLGMGIVAVASVKYVGGVDVLVAEVPKTYFSLMGDSPMNTLAGALGTAISFLAASNVTNALFGAKNQKSANRGILLAGLLALPFAMMPAVIGICAKVALPGITANGALYGMANSIGSVFSGLVSMAILAAIWSTAPALLIVVAGTMTKDFYRVIYPKATEKMQLRFSYLVIICAGIFGTILGMNAQSILDQMLGAFQIRSIVGIVLLAALIWPRVDNNAAFWSMLGGGAVAAIWFFSGNPFGIASLWPATAVCLAIMIPMTLMNKDKVSVGYQKYMEAKKELEQSQS